LQRSGLVSPVCLAQRGRFDHVFYANFDGSKRRFVARLGPLDGDHVVLSNGASVPLSDLQHIADKRNLGFASPRDRTMLLNLDLARWLGRDEGSRSDSVAGTVDKVAGGLVKMLPFCPGDALTPLEALHQNNPAVARRLPIDIASKQFRRGVETGDAIDSGVQILAAASLLIPAEGEMTLLGTASRATKLERSAAKGPPYVYRQGTFADEATGWKGNYVKGKQWATDNPLTTPDYAKKYGLPGENTGKPDWIVGGRPRGDYTTRPAPPSHNNPANTGGATEVLPSNPNDVFLDFFHMPD
jgi:hypothetical protein